MSHRFVFFLRHVLVAGVLAACTGPLWAQNAPDELVPNGVLETVKNAVLETENGHRVLKLSGKGRLDWNAPSPVKAGVEYVLSVRAKGENVQLPADKGGLEATKWQGLRLVLWAQLPDKPGALGKPIFSKTVRGTFDWQPLEARFTMPEGATRFTLFFDLMGGVTGVAFLDDLSLRPSGETPAPQVVDPKTETAAPLVALPVPKPGDVLLLANYPFEPDAADPKKIADAGPLKLHGQIVRDGVSFAPGHTGQGLRFTKRDDKALIKPSVLFHNATRHFTVSAWVKLDTLPNRGEWAAIATKRTGNTASPFAFGVGDQGQLMWQGFNGLSWAYVGSKTKLKVGQWTHVAATFQGGEEIVLYVNGEASGRKKAELPMYATQEPLVLGWDVSGRGALQGTLDELHFYASALKPEQIQLDMKGVLTQARAPVAADLPKPGYPVKLTLGRFDMPQAFRSFDGRRLQDATRVPGPNATDWPTLTLDGAQTLFSQGPSAVAEVPLLSQADAKNWFKTPKDHVISPINHWFRANDWMFNRKYVYTTDRTARGSGSAEYELWTFPVQIKGGKGEIETVSLKLGGEEIYNRKEKLDSLTLLLPANLNGSPYELSVNGHGPVKFDVGLKPVTLGQPEDVPLEINTPVPGTQIQVQSLQKAPMFPHLKEWDADLKLLAAWQAPPTPQVALTGFGRYLGLSVPRSSVGVFTSAMRAGMSGGHFFNRNHIAGFEGTPNQYAAHLQANGYDFAIDDAQPKTLDEGTALDEWVAAMARRGLRAGANPDVPGTTGSLGNPNLAFYSSFLPEWGAPAYRDAQLVAQRLGKSPNFLGFLIGADNAGYAPFWDWAASNPQTPWGRAYVQFRQGEEFQHPVGPGLRPSKTWERKGTQREFVDYLARYDRTFERYGYFARALREVQPDAILTSGSFGSSPGGGARGGWPWASIPGQSLAANLSVQTAYDWNELSSSKPLHNLALVDRLRSYYPDKPTWALIDDFGLLFGREARQRAYALALTRGVDAVGTTFLAHETGDPNYRSAQLVKLSVEPRVRCEVIEEQKELYGWIHKYAGAYSQAQPLASVGVLFVQQQAISRPILAGDANVAQARTGSHEGKTTEALFLSHQAGWPAKIVTPAELKRGLPPEMKALLLVGLNRFDTTWLWSDGLENELKKFVAGGGKLLLDDESVAPEGIAAQKTGLQVAAYIIQSKVDLSPALHARNAENAQKLRAALEGVEKPLAVGSDTVWAVPHQNGDTQYVTVVNWGFEEGKNASRFVKGQTGTLTWNTTRPIYDVATGKKLSAQEAQSVDLTKDGFRLYALPPREITAPVITTSRDKAGFWTATVATGASGVPVQLNVAGNGETATLSGSSGTPIRLPIGPTDAGNYALTASELLSNQSAKAELQATVLSVVAPDERKIALQNFAARKDVPLVVALTPEQQQNPQIAALAKKIADFYVAKGRRVETRPLTAGEVVLSLQPLRAQQKFPQWRTVKADLVLLGTPQTNVLILDQARGGLLTEQSRAQVTYSPFVGEYQALNLVASDGAGLSEIAVKLMATP